jgi:elongation factor G
LLKDEGGIMADRHIDKVKNLVLVGQGGVGKTMLAESMLHLSGKTTRLGGHAGTRPTLDYDEEEGARGFSISMTIAPVIWQGIRINVLDAPCYPDFIGDAYSAMSACEAAVFVINGSGTIGSSTTKLWFAAEDLSLARAVFINRLDQADANFEATLVELREHLGTNLAAVTLPMAVGTDFNGIIDVIHMKARYLEGTKPTVEDIPDDYIETASRARDALIEAVVEADDEMMMKYLDGDQITQEELEHLLAKAFIKRIFVPVFAGSCMQEEGVISLMDAAAEWFPAMVDYGSVPLVNGEKIGISPHDDRPVAFVFKSLNDHQNGRLSFLKVLAGTLSSGLELNNARTRKTERLGHLYLMCGHDMTDIKKCAAGDICVVPKLNVLTGDTLSVTGKVEAAAFRFPNSLYRIAIEPDSLADEGKMFSYLEKATDADPTIKLERNEDTEQTVISAIGEAQVSVLLDRLKNHAAIGAHTVELRIPYRETIRRIASAEGRYKKQTGGAGQYGDCWLRLEPNPNKGYEFSDEVVGGHIPRNFIPAINKGIQEAMKEGILAGYPVIDVRAAVYDGSYHPVDSSEIAFKTAARIGFQKAAAQAEPVVLEPMAHLKIEVPDSYAGSVMGDISASRGRVEGMEAGVDMQVGQAIIEAIVPYAEVTDYATRLRSLSRGTGEFEMELMGYEQVPREVQNRLAQQYLERRSSGR